MSRTHRYKVIGLDVWGHGPDEHEKYHCDGECDGYTVNDAHYCGEIDVAAVETIYNAGTPRQSSHWGATDTELIRVLVDGAYLTPDCTADVIEVEGEDDYTLYLNRKEDGKPLLQLERVI